MSRAVVFAYHGIGARCLATLLAHEVDVPLVVTHQDDPAEAGWFDSVAELARLHEIAVATPDNPSLPDFVGRLRALQPDFIFSFYYRLMLSPQLLATATQGCLNMHGSLLPKYRGRAPINWAIINGERETGATLHDMVEKPDAGAIVDQQSVPILPDDTALDVYRKVTTAAEIVLHRSLPALVEGRVLRRSQNLPAGSYFGRRSPEDGLIDWSMGTDRIHNLVRALAPPYPGAFFRFAGKVFKVLKTFKVAAYGPRVGPAQLIVRGPELYLKCSDGGTLRILGLEIDGIAAGPMEVRRCISGDSAILQ